MTKSHSSRLSTKNPESVRLSKNSSNIIESYAYLLISIRNEDKSKVEKLQAVFTSLFDNSNENLEYFGNRSKIHRLMPYSTTTVNQAVNKLVELGLLKEHSKNHFQINQELFPLKRSDEKIEITIELNQTA